MSELPLTPEEIKTLVKENGKFETTVRLTWEEILWEDSIGINSLISERICGNEGLLCDIVHQSIKAGGEGKDMYVDLTVSADPRLIFKKNNKKKC